MYALLLFALVMTTVKCQFSECSGQLFATYRDFLPNGTVPLQPIFYSTGVDADGAYVQLLMAFHSVANQYVSQAEVPLPTPYINYMSFDVPYCTTKVTIQCSSVSFLGLGKNMDCGITDFDVLGTNPLRGRVVLVPHPTTCGTAPIITVKLYGAILTNLTGTPFSVFTYQSSRLLYGPDVTPLLQTPDEAIAAYQGTTCSASGSLFNIPQGQDQMACWTAGIHMSCPTPRPHNSVDLSEIPTLEYQCINSTNGHMIWSLTSYHEADAFNFVRCQFTACSGDFYDTACRNPNPTYPILLASGARQQVDSPFGVMGRAAAISYIPRAGPLAGQRTDIQANAIYALSPQDPIAGKVECACGINIFCDARTGSADFTNQRFVWPDNVEPVAIIGGEFQPNSGGVTIPTQWPEVLLIGNLSYDTDNKPGPLELYWSVYSKPAGSPAIPIPDPTVTNLLVDTSSLPVGNYTFLLRAGDGQDTSYSLSTILIVNNVITCDISDGFVAPFYPLKSCPTAITDDSSVTLNASTCIGTNASRPLFFNWTQTSGSTLANPYNCSNALANPLQQLGGIFDVTNRVTYFVPNVDADFGFQLTVTDGENTVFFFITVSVDANFTRPIPDNVTVTQQPTDPANNLTVPDLNTSNFTEFTDAPLGPIAPVAPLAPTSGPSGGGGLFPDKWPPTFMGRLYIFFICLWWTLLLMLLFGYMIYESPNDEIAEDDIMLY